MNTLIYQSTRPRKQVTFHCFSLAVLLFLFVATRTGEGRVVVASVNPEGGSVGLLQAGDVILYVNGTRIDKTDDLHSFLSKAMPNDIVLVQTEHKAVIIRLGNQTPPKLGIGITNINRTKLVDEETPLLGSDPSNQTKLEEEPKGGLTLMSGFLILTICLILVLVTQRERHSLIKIRLFVQGPKPVITHSVVLFLSAIISRLLYTLCFFGKFGDHATNVLELWFYVDVAKGHGGFLHPLDPTRVILRFFGLISPEVTPFYATVACAIILASLVPVLIYFLAREDLSQSTAFIAGMLYVFMVQPVGLSSASFTHHIIQIPIALLFLLMLRRAIRDRGTSRFIYFILCACFAILGALVNYEILVYLAVGYAVVFLAVINWLFEHKGWNTDRNWGVIMVSIVILSTPIFLFFDDLIRIADRIAPVRPLEYGQIVHEPIVSFVTGMPLPPLIAVRFYGVLLLLIPFGLYVCYKKRYALPFLLLLLGLVISLHWGRGSRIMDIALAMVGAMAIGNWRSEWTTPTFPLAALLVVWTLSMGSGYDYIRLFLWLSIGGAIAALLVGRRQATVSRLSIAGVVIAFFIATNTMSFAFREVPQSTQAEYQALRWLMDNSDDGSRILTALDHGHLPEAIAGIESVSDEYDFRPDVSKAFNEIEELAALNLAENNVTHVLVSSSDATVQWRNDGSGELYTRGYINFGQRMVGTEIPYLLLVRLTYPDGNLKYFREIHTQEDRATRQVIRIYRVLGVNEANSERPRLLNRVTLSVIVANKGAIASRIWIPFRIVDQRSNSLIVVDSITVEAEAKTARAIIVEYEILPRPWLSLELPSPPIESVAKGMLPVKFFIENVGDAGNFLVSYQGHSHDGAPLHLNVTDYLPSRTGEMMVHSLPISPDDYVLGDISITRLLCRSPSSVPSIRLPLESPESVSVYFAQID